MGQGTSYVVFITFKLDFKLIGSTYISVSGRCSWITTCSLYVCYNKFCWSPLSLPNYNCLKQVNNQWRKLKHYFQDHAFLQTTTVVGTKTMCTLLWKWKRKLALKLNLLCINTLHCMLSLLSYLSKEYSAASYTVTKA